tara:strand:- start:641 stop:916 length:276 start_codon:yes stop_codon:yes gene_type:complete
MTEEICFNTNRQYSDEGQIIHAKRENGVVTFADVTRKIYGSINYDDYATDWSYESASVFQALVMKHYDRNWFYPSIEAYHYFLYCQTKEEI